MRKFVENLARGKILRKKNDSQASSRFFMLLCLSCCPRCWSFQCHVAFSPQKHKNISNAFSNVTRQQHDKWIAEVEADSNFMLFLYVSACLPNLFPSHLEKAWWLSVSLCFMQRFIKVTIFWLMHMAVVCLVWQELSDCEVPPVTLQVLSLLVALGWNTLGMHVAHY